MELYTSDLARLFLGAAIEVHSQLGPGLLESTYEHCLAHELTLRGIRFARQVPLPVQFKGTQLDCGYRVDFVLEQELVVELKTVKRLLPIHKAQLLTYLRLLKLRQGFLVNFNSVRLIDGVRSVLND